MDFNYKKEQDFSIVTLYDSRLDASQVNDFKEYFTDLIEKGERHLILDLTQIQFIDSSGLGAVVAIKKHLMSCDEPSTMSLAAPQAAVNDLLDLTCMNKLFSIFPSVEDALT
ncbi:MAG: STAS domain-containing protein [Endozoicomonadaceae bacterium]|nr:STAS domain-containing protein [Endozoicomonadaceae bacterium]